MDFQHPFMDLPVSNPQHIAVIIESLAHEAMNTSNGLAKWKLEQMFAPLNNAFDMPNRSNLAKLTAVIAFLNHDYARAEKLIKEGVFDEADHKFMRMLYKATKEKTTEQSTSSNQNTFFVYPSNIDMKDADGIAETTSEYIKNYYITKKLGHKAIKPKRVAELTKLPVKVVTARMNYHRDQMSTKGLKFLKVQKVSTAPGTQKVKPLVPKTLDIPSNPATFYENMFPYLPSPPMEAHDFFPTHRIPLDQPLTIIIPN